MPKTGKTKVLFVCIHNSARSQMAEAFLKQMASDRFDVDSAGIEPGNLNPVAVQAMQDAGIDISGNTTKSVQSLIDAREEFDYIITVCDEASAERCPVFPGKGTRIHMGFEDPSSFEGTEEQKLQKTIAVRDRIREVLKDWVAKVSND